MVVDSAISVAKVCDCVISAWFGQLCDRVVQLPSPKYSVPAILLFRRCLA